MASMAFWFLMVYCLFMVLNLSAECNSLGTGMHKYDGFWQGDGFIKSVSVGGVCTNTMDFSRMGL